MQYPNIIPAQFLRRPNRFIAYVDLGDGAETVVHVKNTGRCKELLLPGTTVYLAVSDNPARKTKYDLIAVEKKRDSAPPLLINMDSQIPNDVAEEWLPHSGLFSPNATIKREVTWRNSRFDFYIEDGTQRTFLEVKGVTLEHHGIASFPDAPTERGVKHIHELIDCLQEGFKACILFVIQMKEMRELRPNDITHPAFGDALRKAAKAGVRILAMDCIVTPDSIAINAPVNVNTTGK